MRSRSARTFAFRVQLFARGAGQSKRRRQCRFRARSVISAARSRRLLDVVEAGKEESAERRLGRPVVVVRLENWATRRYEPGGL